MSEIIIRDARPKDAAFVAWTILTALDMEADEADRLRESCAAPGSMYSWTNAIVAEADGKPVGCLVGYDGARYAALREYTWPKVWTDVNPDEIKATPAETGPGEFYLDSMAVLPEYRGTGSIGKQLMTHAMEKARKDGHRKFSLLVDVDKPRLQAYYASLGFANPQKVQFLAHRFNKMTLEL